MAVQRVRIHYGRSGDLQYVAHLDLIRLWERAFRRAGIPAAYSEGHTPRPRLSIASALPIGVTSEAELLDVYLKRRLAPFYFLKLLEPQLPATIQVFDARDVPLDWPSLQSQVRKASYDVVVETDADAPSLEQAIRSLLDKETLPWEHRRDQEVRRYDLRELVHDIWLVEPPRNGRATLGMLLKADPKGSGRPEQVTAALGLTAAPVALHRTRLILADPPGRRTRPVDADPHGRRTR